MIDMMINNVKDKSPLILNITNYVTVNDCANMILAAGGAPLMSDEIDEMDDLLNISSTLYINMGTLNKRTITTMVEAGKMANDKQVPVVFDPVGVGASKLRNETVDQILEQVKVDVIKGNMTEIKAIVHRQANKSGVDVSQEDMVTEDNLQEAVQHIKEYAKALNTTLVVTGVIDVITDGQKVWIIRNGAKTMAKITGTGCMLGAIIATYCGANQDNRLEAAATATLVMALSGELANKKMIAQCTGNGSFRTYLTDYMSRIDDEVVSREANYEIQ